MIEDIYVIIYFAGELPRTGLQSLVPPAVARSRTYDTICGNGGLHEAPIGLMALVSRTETCKLCHTTVCDSVTDEWRIPSVLVSRLDA